MSIQSLSRITTGLAIAIVLAAFPLLAPQKANASPPNPFTMTITIPANLSGTTGFPLYLKNFIGTIDWGDGSATESFTVGVATQWHHYPAAATDTDYHIAATGTADGYSPASGSVQCAAFGGWVNYVDSVDSWGDLGSGFTSLEGAFFNARNLTSVPNSLPSSVTNLHCTFDGASKLDSDLSNWDTSNVITMNDLFYRCALFNSSLSNWDTSSVTDMSGLFGVTGHFNQDLSTWDVSHVTNMTSMFGSATAFDGDISNWDTRQVTDMTSMFADATNFNQALKSDSVLHHWEISSVSAIDGMFNGASRFNQSLSSWDISNITTADEMFDGSGIDSQNYSSTLIGWGRHAIQASVPVGWVNAYFSSAATAPRQALLAAGWQIYDLGIEPITPTPIPSGDSSSGNALASTGVEPGMWTGAALLALLVGLALVFARRARRY